MDVFDSLFTLFFSNTTASQGAAEGDDVPATRATGAPALLVPLVRVPESLFARICAAFRTIPAGFLRLSRPWVACGAPAAARRVLAAPVLRAATNVAGRAAAPAACSPHLLPAAPVLLPRGSLAFCASRAAAAVRLWCWGATAPLCWSFRVTGRRRGVFPGRRDLA